MKDIIRRMQKHGSGQGLVEFALILPLLLLLSLGIIEVGRLLVVFTSVSAASREAARYASAAGNSDAGVPYYLDIAGIQAAASRIASLTGGVVSVTYDHGGADTCSITGSTFNATVASDVVLGDRVVVQVTAQYTPLLGVTPLSAFPVVSTTCRTILKQVSIYGNPGGGGGGGGTLTVNIDPPANGATFLVGESVYFVATVSNYTGTVTYNWSASGIGDLGITGDSFSYVFTTEDDYDITVTVTDAVGTATDTITIHIIVDHPPVVTINSPPDGSDFNEGETINFSASAIDDIDGDISATIDWYIDGNLVQSDSATYSTATLLPGTHSVEARAADSGGQVGSDVITIAVNDFLGPVVEINSPADGAYFPTGTNITFSATAVDAVDGNVAASLVWTDNGVQFGTGPSFSTTTLTVGTHNIVATAVDSGGRPGTDSIVIYVTVGNQPNVLITSPIAGTIFDEGDIIDFTATASDVEDGNLTGDIQWYINNVWVGEGGSLPSEALDPGAYIIRAEVTDSDGNIDVDTAGITVRDNLPPVVTIIAPDDGAQFSDGDEITFSGIATDDLDGDISNLIMWSSDLMSGSLGTGETIHVSNLIVGTHTITARVQDTGMLYGTDTISITVQSDPCVIQVTPGVIGNKDITWGFINNASVSYTLIRVSLPWSDSQSAQSLD